LFSVVNFYFGKATIHRLAIGLILLTILIMVLLNSSFDEVGWDKSAVITPALVGFLNQQAHTL
jgi:hypothetical protein